MSRSTDSPDRAPDVVVSVGTDHHRFDRLMAWIDAWASTQPEVIILVQRGTSSPPRHVTSVELLPHPDLLRRFEAAAAVVCHGGPSTVMDARQAGRRPIVVARDPALGEHVDDHQLRFAEHLVRHDLAEVVADGDELAGAIEAALAAPERFAVPIGTAAAAGVVAFGRTVDELLAGIDEGRSA